MGSARETACVGVDGYSEKYYENERWRKNEENIRLDWMCEVVTVSWKNNRVEGMGRDTFEGSGGYC